MSLFDDERFQDLLSRIKASGLNLEDYATDEFDAVLAHVDGVFVGANQAVVELGEYDSIDDVIGRNALTFIERGSFHEVMKRILESDPGPYKAILLSKKGKRLPALLRAAHVTIGGEMVRIVSARLIPE